MGRYRGQHIPDDYNSNYTKVEGQEEYWYWYMAGYEDGLLDTYNQVKDHEVKRLQQDVSSLLDQASARERVLKGLQDIIDQSQPPQT